jgi:hypothetical protein
MIYEYRELRWDDTGRRKPKNSEKSFSQCHFDDTNLIWTVPDSSPDLRGERPASEYLGGP